jgi:hypothetical protein
MTAERKARSSGALLPSPPAEKSSARQDQAGKASAGDGAGDRRCSSCHDENAHGSGHDCRTDITLGRERKSPAILGEVEDFGDRERLARREAGERHGVNPEHVAKIVLSDQRAAASDIVVAEQSAATADENLLGDGEAVNAGRHFIGCKSGRQSDRVAGRDYALPRRIEANVAALRGREAVVKRKLKRRRQTAKAAAQDVPARRNDHGDKLIEAKSAAKQQWMLNNLDDGAGRSDRARRGGQLSNRASDGFIPPADGDRVGVGRV